MKLLFFIHTLNGGGAERVLVNLTNELVRRGHDITIALNTSETLYEIDSRIRIHVADSREWYRGRSLVRRWTRNQKMKWHFYRHTKKAIKDTKPDIIISFLHCNLWPIILLHGKTPIVHSEHNAYDRVVTFTYHFNRFILNRFFNKVCVLTSFDQGYALAKGLKNTIVMPNPNTFSSIDEENYKLSFSKRKNLLICGRTRAWRIKGLDIAIKAFSRIANIYSDIDLDIVGLCEEPSLSLLKQIAIELGVSSRVHFLGQCTDIQSVFRQHKLLVLSSRSEGFPMVVTEAMSQGLPCVAFERLASSIINTSIDGYLVYDGDITELCVAIQELLSNEEQRFMLGLEARKNVMRFSASEIANRWENMFISLIN